MDYLEILFYYINNPNIFFSVAEEFFDQLHGGNIINDYENLSNCDEDNYII